MNLVIGRKNVFEDIQYIDPAIYQSLIGLKKMPDEELEDMQQTFVIQDQLPGGRTKYVNLLCPSKPVKGTEDEFALVTRYFLLHYSDKINCSLSCLIATTSALNSLKKRQEASEKGS